MFHNNYEYLIRIIVIAAAAAISSQLLDKGLFLDNLDYIKPLPCFASKVYNVIFLYSVRSFVLRLFLLGHHALNFLSNLLSFLLVMIYRSNPCCLRNFMMSSWYVLISFFFYLCIGMMVRVFANGPGDQGSTQVESYQRLKKWYLMPPCLTLSIISYRSRVKWSNPEKGVAPSATHWCSSY